VSSPRSVLLRFASGCPSESVSSVQALRGVASTRAVAFALRAELRQSPKSQISPALRALKRAASARKSARIAERLASLQAPSRAASVMSVESMKESQWLALSDVIQSIVRPLTCSTTFPKQSPSREKRYKR
jgi:hypothetical protein